MGAELHHVVTAEAVLPALLAVVGADGFAIQEGAVQAASVSDLPAALTGVPPDHHMVPRHLSVRHRQGVVLQPPNSHLLPQEHHVSRAVQCSAVQCSRAVQLKLLGVQRQLVLANNTDVKCHKGRWCGRTAVHNMRYAVVVYIPMLCCL